MSESIRYFLLLGILAVLFQGIKCDSGTCEVSSGSDTSTTETLRDRLLCEYDRISTPSDETTLVRVDFHLTRLSLALKAGLALMDVNMTMQWTDPRLKWDSSLFDVDEVIFGRYEIWLPDIEPLNSVRSGAQIDDPACVVRNTGLVTCLMPLAMEVTCGDTTLRWPNDRHSCEVEISSLSHNSKDFRIQLHAYTTPIDSNFTGVIRSPLYPLSATKDIVSEGWILHNATTQVITELYHDYEWTSIALNVDIQRDIASHVIYLAAPFFVLSLLSLSPSLLPATGSSLNARLILGGVAITGHILQLQNLAAVVPDSIDWQAPYIVCLHRDAMWAACILLILSMPGAMLLDGGIPGMDATLDAPQPQSSKPPPAVFVKSAAWLLSRVPTGALLLDNETDVSALVESGKDDPTDAQTTPTSARSWRALALVFDRLLLFIFLVVYASLLLAYLT